MSTVFAQPETTAGNWSRLPAVPDAEGFAGMFAGVSDGALLVAGGANIVGERWGSMLNKVWYDDVYGLARPDGAWRKIGKLGRPNGYGVSATVPGGMLCVGGGDAREHFREAAVLSWDGEALQTKTLPALPKPCAFMCGAVVDGTLYLAGGSERPDATTALKTFWALDLAKPDGGWRELEPCPGPERILAVAGADRGNFYLFSGARLFAGADGKPAREYLRDAWRYQPGTGWKRLPDLPAPAVAAPSPAPNFGGRLLICSGDDGTNVTFDPVERHPGFPRATQIYDIDRELWTTTPGLPFSRATAPVVAWADGFVVPNGEVRPRVRTPEVWRLALPGPAR